MIYMDFTNSYLANVHYTYTNVKVNENKLNYARECIRDVLFSLLLFEA